MGHGAGTLPDPPRPALGPVPIAQPLGGPSIPEHKVETAVAQKGPGTSPPSPPSHTETCREPRPERGPGSAHVLRDQGLFLSSAQGPRDRPACGPAPPRPLPSWGPSVDHPPLRLLALGPPTNPSAQEQEPPQPGPAAPSHHRQQAGEGLLRASQSRHRVPVPSHCLLSPQGRGRNRGQERRHWPEVTEPEVKPEPVGFPKPCFWGVPSASGCQR